MASEQESRFRFEQCVESCADSLYRVAFRLTGDSTLASELVQETFLNAWQNLESLRDPERIRGWMFSILRNQYSKLVRKESRSGASLSHDVVAPAERSEEQRDDVSEQVQQAIDGLDDKHKLPLLLVAMEQLSVDEAARVLDLPRGTVLSRLHRGRQKLKSILERQLQKTG